MNKRWTGWLLLSALTGTVLAAHAAPLQVTQVHGTVQQGARSVRLLDMLDDGASLTLAEAAILVGWDAQSDRRYVFAGPSRVMLTVNGPVLAGSGSMQVLAPRRPLRAAPNEATVMAGAIMRSATPSAPQAHAALQAHAAPAPGPDAALPPASTGAPAQQADRVLPLALATFNWRNRPHIGDWIFRLHDGSGALVHEATVAAPRYRLPPQLLLAPAQAYRWSVAWHDGSAVVQGPSQPVQTMARQPVVMPGAHASAAERAGAALLLRDNGQLEQARQLAPALLDDTP